MNIRKLATTIVVSIAAIATTAVFGQAPAGSTGQCKDGTYTSAKNERGACSRHGGVKTWFAESKGAAKEPAKATTQEPAKAPAAAATTEAPAKPAAKAARKAPAKTTTATTEAAPGGGPGMVWVNTPTKVYHCSGDRWYGKTKKGEYMSEADAKAKGFRPSRNKACG